MSGWTIRVSQRTLRCGLGEQTIAQIVRVISGAACVSHRRALTGRFISKDDRRLVECRGGRLAKELVHRVVSVSRSLALEVCATRDVANAVIDKCLGHPQRQRSFGSPAETIVLKPRRAIVRINLCEHVADFVVGIRCGLIGRIDHL